MVCRNKDGFLSCVTWPLWASCGSLPCVFFPGSGLKEQACQKSATVTAEGREPQQKLTMTLKASAGGGTCTHAPISLAKASYLILSLVLMGEGVKSSHREGPLMCGGFQ